MATYIMSDLHGQYEDFKYLMKESNMNLETDTLHILGDYVDWGTQSCELVLVLYRLKKKYPNNLYLYLGNHDLMFLNAIKEGQTSEDVKFSIWGGNNGYNTYKSYNEQTNLEKTMIRDFLEELEVYRVIEVGGKRYYLTHSVPFIEQGEHSRAVYECVWDRAYLNNPIIYPPDITGDITLISGHTMVHHLTENMPEYQLEKNEIIMIFPNNQICLDCGAKCIGSGGKYRLGLLRLGDMESLYSDGGGWIPVRVFTISTKQIQV